MRRDCRGLLIFEAPTSLHRLTYYHDPRIHRRIRYGPAEREYLDIYAPQTREESDMASVAVKQGVRRHACQVFQNQGMGVAVIASCIWQGTKRGPGEGCKSSGATLKVKMCLLIPSSSIPIGVMCCENSRWMV